jgi:hypothetical protein
MSGDERVLAALAALFDRYGIDRGDWPGLAIKLAFLHEPTVRQLADEARPRGGRRRRWHDARLFALWLDVDSLVRDKGKVLMGADSVAALRPRLRKPAP